MDENKIVYDRLQTIGKLHQKSRGTTKEETVSYSFFFPIPLIVELVTLAPSATPIMAKTLRDYSTPTVANVPVGPAVNTGTRNFELWTGLILMV